MPQYGFPGLRAGDQWCVCAARWAEALEAGVACPVVLESTHLSALEFVDLDDLRAHAVALSGRALPPPSAAEEGPPGARVGGGDLVGRHPQRRLGHRVDEGPPLVVVVQRVGDALEQRAAQVDELGRRRRRRRSPRW